MKKIVTIILSLFLVGVGCKNHDHHDEKALLLLNLLKDSNVTVTVNNEPGDDSDTGSTETPACVDDAVVDVSRGRWFVNEEGGFHTFWANQKLVIWLDSCERALYEIKLKTRNTHGPLPPNYTHFIVKVRTATENFRLLIPSSDTIYYDSSVNFASRGGLEKVTITWKNDSYKKEIYDANLHVRDISIIKRKK